MKLKRYNKNLKVEGNKVFSYSTHVATIEGSKLIQLGYWSVTTQKHINYVARELNLTLSKQDQKEKESDPILNSMKAFLLMGDLMNDKKEDTADAVKYKERIVFATMRSKIPNWQPPSDWERLNDSDKLERLTKIQNL
tara:strand:+ start:3737 stop:4150 length:414 start_codon:yes stop_codon:yes gene_type:complete